MLHKSKYNKIYRSIWFFNLLVITAALCSCNQVKYVPEGKYLLAKNEIVFIKDSLSPLSILNKQEVSEDELLPILKQKANKRIIIGKFHLWLYNRTNQEKIDAKIVKKQTKADRKNTKIEAKNRKKQAKNPNYKKKQPVDRKKSFGEKLRTAGEAPVILDSIKIQKSTKQLNLYLIKKGYFHNHVTDTIIFLDKKPEGVNIKRKLKQQAKVIYYINPKLPYKVKSYVREIKDTAIAKVVSVLSVDSIIQVGENFDTDDLESERTRITDYLLEQGFFYFNKSFIYFKVDSAVGVRQVSLSLGIQNFKYKDLVHDTMLDKPHKAFKIGAVEIYPHYDPKDDEYTAYESLTLDGVEVKYKFRNKIKPKLLVNSVLFKEGNLYRKTLEEATYKKFMGLGTYRSVSIKYDTLNNELIAKIFLRAAKAQTFQVAADGTHTNGLFGIEGSMTYTHSNVFGGAERLQITMAGGLEMQRLIFASDSTSSNITSEVTNVNELAKTFNTVEFGPKITLTIPRMMIIQPIIEKIVKRHLANPKTEFSTSLNYQRRPDFKRGIQEFTFGWIYHEKPAVTIRIKPIILSAIAIEKSALFQQRIDDLNDRFLAASYQSHIIGGGKVSFVYNGQNDKKVRNTFYFQTTFETAGNILRGLYQMTNKPFDDTLQRSYNLLNIRFAQFIKVSGDLRYYLPLSKRSKVVYRVAGGVGIPLANLSEALPFEKSFYAGGSNGIRAWKARTLGPGSYRDPDVRFDKIGDIQLEGNVELRFPLTSWIEGAMFVDAGNIWSLNEDSLRPGGQFNPETFLSEIAFGGGLGVRLDLDFFVIRLDFAMPVRNPAMPVSERWIWEGGIKDARKPFYRPQFNLGIGYPF